MVPSWPLLQRSRELTWDGCLNVRDLGGHRTEDGAETRFGAIVRADSVRQLSGDGWAALIDYGVTTIVDLRGDHERQEDPPHDVPVEVLHVPFMEADESEWKEIETQLDAAARAARVHQLAGDAQLARPQVHVHLHEQGTAEAPPLLRPIRVALPSA